MIKRRRRPSSPGTILKDLFLDERGYKISGLSRDLEVSRKHLSQIINGHRRITPNLWLNLQNAVDIWEAEREFSASRRDIGESRSAP